MNVWIRIQNLLKRIQQVGQLRSSINRSEPLLHVGATWVGFIPAVALFLQNFGQSALGCTGLLDLTAPFDPAWKIKTNLIPI